MILNEEKIERVTILLQNIIRENSKAGLPWFAWGFQYFCQV